MEITLAPEPLFHIGGLVVTNTMLTTVLVVLVLTILGIIYRSTLSLESPGRFQSTIEWVLTWILSLSENTAGRTLGRRIYPLVATFFLFILTANWIGLLPGFSVITVTNFENHRIPLFRSANSDLNMTIAMALIAVTTVQVVGIMQHGLIGYIKELTTPLFLAPIHLISEISRVISLSGRLFGNIFGGEVLMMVMYSMIPYFVPTIFLGLEFLFGFIQALIFTVLSMVYIALAATPQHE